MDKNDLIQLKQTLDAAIAAETPATRDTLVANLIQSLQQWRGDEALTPTRPDLESNDAQYRLLADNAPLPVVLIAPDDGTILYANQRTTDLFEIPLAQARHQRMFDFYVNPQERWRYLQRLREQGHLSGYEMQMKTARGRPLWVVASSSVITFAGRPAIFAIFSDITDCKRAEQAEREQRALAEALRDTAAALNETLYFDEILDRILVNVGRVVPHDGINVAIVDHSGEARIIRARRYGDHEAQATIYGQPLLVAEIPLLRQMAETGDPCLISDTQAGPVEDALIDRTWVRSYVSAPIRSRGVLLGFIALASTTPGFFAERHADRLQIFADQAGVAIENARLYDEAIRRAEQMTILYQIGLTITSGLDMTQVMQSIFEQCRQVLPLDAFYIAVYDAETGLIEHPLFYDQGTYHTHAPRDIHTKPGLSGQVILSRQTLYLPDTLDPETVQVYQIIRSGGNPTRSYLGVPLMVRDRPVGVISIQSYRPNAYTSDQIHLLETIATQAAVAIENARFYAQVSQHAQELEAANRQAQEARIAAEAADRAKSVFLANMSHELRTPLNAILGFSDLMARDARLSPEQQENLRIINRSGEHLRQLINEVLDMAKIEAGRVTVQEQAFDLHLLIDDLVEMFRLRAAEKGLTLTVNLAPGVPRYVVADDGKLRQILINLLGNAIKFTPTGGVTLRVQEERSEATVVPYSSTLLLEVEDTGPGIAAEEIEMIFEPFVQSASGEKLHEGTGLGLAISRQFAQLMDGTLTVTSTGVPGEGALFTLKIPVRLAEPAGPAGQQRPGRLTAIALEPGQPVYRLLVVEDRPENRQWLVQFLIQLGFEVRAVENGLEAVNLCQEWTPHLIWMDMRMPVMDGYEATRRIKATPQGKAIVIIALTASVFDKDRDRILAAGCNDFMLKPVRQDNLVAALVKHLGVRFVCQQGEGETAIPAASLSVMDSGQSPATLDLAGLPADWLADLQNAAIAADTDRITALAGQIRAEKPAQAAVLVALAFDFAYETILNAIHAHSQQESHNE